MLLPSADRIAISSILLKEGRRTVNMTLRDDPFSTYLDMILSGDGNDTVEGNDDLQGDDGSDFEDGGFGDDVADCNSTADDDCQGDEDQNGDDDSQS